LFSALRQDNMQNQNLIGSKRHHNNAAQHCPRHNLYTLEHFSGQIYRDSRCLTIIPLAEGLRESYFPPFVKKPKNKKHFMQIIAKRIINEKQNNKIIAKKV